MRQAPPCYALALRTFPGYLRAGMCNVLTFCLKRENDMRLGAFACTHTHTTRREYSHDASEAPRHGIAHVCVCVYEEVDNDRARVQVHASEYAGSLYSVGCVYMQ